MRGFFNPRMYDKAQNHEPVRLPQCGRCGLLKKCHSPKMVVGGSNSSGVLFLGDAPSSSDDREGRHFSSDGGEFLREVVEDLGFSLDDCLMTNSIICHPPKKVEPYMLSSCRPHLLSTLDQMKPKVVVALGGEATTSMLRNLWSRDIGSITKWAGYAIPLSHQRNWLIPTYHPDQVVREKNTQYKTIFTQHIAKAFKFASQPPKFPVPLDELKKKVELIEGDQAHRRLEALARKTGFLSWDYETTGLKPDRSNHKIISVAFCLGGEETFSFMMDESLVEPVRKVLLNPRLKKIGSNVKYEERWTRARFGHGVRGWYWDTMLTAHLIDNRPGICSLKFQAFINFGVPDYDSHLHEFLMAKTPNAMNEITSIPPQELLLYNGLDALLQYMLMVRQKTILRQGGL